jgi:mRNA-degrading endonuclease RelE of RelBE toxin-antitoxin system
MYDVELAETARRDLQWFAKYDQNIIVDGIRRRLRDAPMVEDRNRKRLRPNAVATWELRIGRFCVLYDVDVQVRVVAIQRIGEKRGNAFFFRGQEEDV